MNFRHSFLQVFSIFSLILVSLNLSFGAGGSVPIMPLSDITPGMLGEGRTVFKGDSIETFDIEVIGTVKNFMPRKDIILARLLGERLQYTGVIGGMSGSPIYIGGKLVGALAYGWTFSKDPIFGITPIEQMLALDSSSSSGTEGAAAPGSGAAAGRASGTPALFNPFEAPANPLLSGDSGPTRPAAGSFTAGGASLTSLEVPLIFSGCQPEVVERYGKIFSRFGLIPLMGGNAGDGSSGSGKNASVEPGSAVSAQLIRGDISLSATGTLTWRDGDHLLAFGHPFLQFGTVDFPLTAAEIITILPNLSRSVKISNSTDFVGSLKTDASNGIYGILGSQPRMIPLDIELTLPDHKVEKYHYEMVRHKLLTPLLGGLTLINTIMTGADAVSEQTLKVSGEIKLRGADPVIIRNMFAGNGTGAELTQDVQVILQYLYSNNYGPAEIESMSLKLDLQKSAPRAGLSEIYLDPSPASPGDSVKIEVVLDPFTRPKFSEYFTVTMPETDTPTRLFVLAGSADQITRAEFQLSPTRFLYSSLNHLVHLINSSKKNNCLYVKVLQPDNGLIVGESQMPNLPPSVWSLLKSEKASGTLLPLNDQVLAEFEKPTGFVLDGFKILQIELNPRP